LALIWFLLLVLLLVLLLLLQGLRTAARQAVRLLVAAHPGLHVCSGSRPRRATCGCGTGAAPSLRLRSIEHLPIPI
jgi:hypothetical protein